MPRFIPGLELSRRFYAELVRPLLDGAFPGLPHAAALIGYGSEVLGFDTEMSMDHAWCPRMQLFLREEDASLAEPIKTMLARALPREFLGFPLDTVPVEGEPGVFWMKPDGDGPVEHKVIPVTLRAFIQANLWPLDEPRHHRSSSNDLSGTLTPRFLARDDRYNGSLGVLQRR